MSAVRVTLSWYEVTHAAIAGVLRQTKALREARDDAAAGRPVELDGWTRHVSGALAECALAKALGLYWDAGMHFRPEGKRGDVGPHAVRSTNRLDGCLIVRPTDFDDVPYWLIITATPPHFTICGFIEGEAAKRPEWWRSPNDRPGAYFVPQSALRQLR